MGITYTYKQREAQVPVFDQHMSPSEVATYMHTRGRGVGRRYWTENEILDTSDLNLQTGLLHLILDELEKINKPKRESVLMRHRHWLNHHREDVVYARNSLKIQNDRIRAMFQPLDYSLSRRLRLDFNWPLETVRSWFMRNVECHVPSHPLFRGLHVREQVKRPEQTIMLPGVGKKTVKKLLELVTNEWRQTS